MTVTEAIQLIKDLSKEYFAMTEQERNMPRGLDLVQTIFTLTKHMKSLQKTIGQFTK